MTSIFYVGIAFIVQRTYKIKEATRHAKMLANGKNPQQRHRREGVAEIKKCKNRTAKLAEAVTMDMSDGI